MKGLGFGIENGNVDALILRIGFWVVSIIYLYRDPKGIYSEPCVRP